MRVLWIDDGGSPGGALPQVLASRWEARLANGMAEGLAWLPAGFWHVVVVVIPQPGWSCAEILESILRANSYARIIVVSRSPSYREAVEAAHLGAFTYLSAGELGTELELALEAAAAESERLIRQLHAQHSQQEPWRRFLVGESRPMQQLLQLVRMVGPRRCTVLITGETGTGKEVIARAIHMASPRAQFPMVAVNCSALPEHLLEAELFGHVKGAFTGAISNRVGRFEQAHRSTIFLDEIGDMPLELQAKLLRVLQEREFQRVGSSETVRVDVRVIAASNRDLEQLVEEGKFREDLYYRLNVVPIRVPPLRARLSDVPLLVEHFIDKICEREQLPPKRVSPEAMKRLCNYSWPGNVRQLENAVEMAVILSGDRPVLYPSDFPLPAVSRPLPPADLPVIALPEGGLDFEATIQQIERSLLEQAMERARGNKKRAAELLRLKRTTFTAKLKNLQEEASDGRAAAGSW